MTLPEIQNALARMPYLHPLTDTNVDELVTVGTAVHFLCDRSDLEEAQANVERLERREEILEERVSERDARIRELEKRLATIERATRSV